jgi:chromosome segregation ATPase
VRVGKFCVSILAYLHFKTPFLANLFVLVSVCAKIYFYTVDNIAKKVYTIYRKKAHRILNTRSKYMNWEEIYGNIRAFAGRAATKINQTADMASLQVKLSMAESKLQEAYGALGKASFGHFVEDKQNFDEIAAGITDVKNAMMEIRSVKAQIEELRQRVADAEREVEAFKDTVSDTAAEAAQAHKAAQEAKREAEERAAAVRARQEEEAEPLEVFHFDDDDIITDLSNTGDAVDVVIEEE